MNDFKTLESRHENLKQTLSENIHKGACVKIKNTQKTFQVIVINPENKICWIREWPFASGVNKTFALETSQIILKVFCPNNFKK